MNDDADRRDDGHLQYLLTAYVFGDISRAGRVEVEGHLAQCAACREELAALRATLGLVQDALAPTADEAPYAFQTHRLERVLAAGRTRRPAWVRAAWTISKVAAGLLLVVTGGSAILWVPMGIRGGPVEHVRERMARATMDAPAAAGGAAYNGERAPRGFLGETVTDGFGVGGGAAGAPTPDPDSPATGPRPRRPESPLPTAPGEKTRREARRPRSESIPSAAPPPSLETEDVLADQDEGSPEPTWADEASPEPSWAANKETQQQTRVRAVRDSLRLRGALAAGKQRLSEEASEAHAGDEMADFETVEGALLNRGDLDRGGDLGRANQRFEAGQDQRADSHDARWKDTRQGAASRNGGGLAAEPEPIEPPVYGNADPRNGAYAHGHSGPAGARSGEDFFERKKHEDDAKGRSGVDPGLEKEIRTLRYFQSMDRNLSLEDIRSRKLSVPVPVVGDEGLGRERFRARYGVNPFVETSRDHLSTFAMDVDTASYSRARALLRAGRLPEPGTVRTEEFVNAFPQDYAADPDRVFSVFCEGGPAPFATGVDLLKITVKARELRRHERLPVVLTFAIDTSGSMFLEGRLDLIKMAIQQLLSTLMPDDQVAVVAYGAQAYLALPHTPAREGTRVMAALDGLRPRGNTNVSSGLALAYRLADEAYQDRGVNRVVLCSDGVATEGDQSAEALLERVKVYAGRGIYLTVVGVGRDRYNDALLETLADRGNGNYAYLDGPQQAAKVFERELPQVLHVLARDAKIQVDFDPATVSHYRLLGYENRDIQDRDFRNDAVDAGEVGPGSTVTALYEIRRRPGAHGDLGRVYLRYHAVVAGLVEELAFPLAPGVLVPRLSDTTPDFRVLACVAEFAELLRESYWARDGSAAEVLEVLRRLPPATQRTPMTAELIELVHRYHHLSTTLSHGR